MRRYHCALSAEVSHAAAGAVCALAAAQRFQRGIPYAPAGTVMDFTSSPRHVGLAELQGDLDRRTGRQGNGVYDGASFVPGVGANPSHFMPFHAPAKDRRSAQEKSFEKLKPWEQEYIRQRLPQKQRRGAFDAIKPELGDNYQADIRTDPEFADMPEHLRAAKHSILSSQSDSYGEVLRGVVPPPPESDPRFAPKAYHQPQVQLNDLWYMLMAAFAVMFFLLAKFGN